MIMKVFDFEYWCDVFDVMMVGKEFKVMIVFNFDDLDLVD